MVPGAVAGPAGFSRASVSRVSQIVRMDRAASAITSWVEWISASVRGGPGPVEFHDDPGERCAQFVGQLSRQLLFVAQDGAYAVEQRVQGGTRPGEFGRVLLVAEALGRAHGAPLRGLVGHPPRTGRRARRVVGDPEPAGVPGAATAGGAGSARSPVSRSGVRATASTNAATGPE